MEKSCFEINGIGCVVYAGEAPEVILMMPTDGKGKDITGELAGLISSMSEKSFILAAFKIDDWNDDLSPWQADAVFKGQAFGGRAGETLDHVLKDLIPEIRKRYDPAKELPVILGGYSLAGLFSLWASYLTDSFWAIAAASPSVWYEGWPEFTKGKVPKTDRIYLSLGNKEEKTGNRTMARVGDRIRAQYEEFTSQGISCVLEWNEGNHFKDVNIRIAKAFARCIK